MGEGGIGWREVENSRVYGQASPGARLNMDLANGWILIPIPGPCSPDLDLCQ